MHQALETPFYGHPGEKRAAFNLGPHHFCSFSRP
jgi:hypothetical protein